MNPFEFHAQTLAQYEASLGTGLSYFQWPITTGAKYPCSSGANTTGNELAYGGFETNNLLRLVVRNAVLTAGLPQAKQEITFFQTANATGKTLRIESVIQSSNQQIILNCYDPTKGVGGGR